MKYLLFVMLPFFAYSESPDLEEMKGYINVNIQSLSREVQFRIEDDQMGYDYMYIVGRLQAFTEIKVKFFEEK